MPPPLRLHSLPLFPLGTVLFPGGVLPLRIFEVRYLDMIGRCHKAGAPFGVVALTAGEEVRKPGGDAESLAAVGTLATIARFEAPQPGLLLIEAQGTHRFRIESTQRLKHGLWVGEVEHIDDDVPAPVPDDLRGVADALGKLLEALQRRQGGAGPRIEPPWRLSDSGWVANRWCELLPLPLALRQRLMELDNPMVRLELVGDLLGKMGIATP